jgi:hypothetical protein
MGYFSFTYLKFMTSDLTILFEDNHCLSVAKPVDSSLKESRQAFLLWKPWSRII